MPDGSETPRPYAATLRERSRRLAKIRSGEISLSMLKAYYRKHIDAFIDDWGFAYTPDNVRRGLPAVIPLTLDPRQRAWVAFTYQNWLDGAYGGTEKSRDVGCSWLSVGFCVALCVLYDGMACGMGSYVGEKVDKSGDMGSLFEKARSFIELLPREFRAGYNARTCSIQRRLSFPNTGSSIIGEIGDNIGRGGRTGIYFVDEAAYLEHSQMVDAALSKNTKCRQDVSSVHGMLNTFAERMHDGISRKFTFHWRDNPRFTQADYEAFLRQWGPVITAQELDIDYQASVEGVLIPALWVQAAIDLHLHLKLKITGKRTGAFDVADKGIDKNAFAIKHGVLLEHAESWSGSGGTISDSIRKCFHLCDKHNVDSFLYDAIGVGADVDGVSADINQARHTRRIPAIAFRGSESPKFPERVFPGTKIKNEDMFANAKAQGWWWLRYLFQNAYRARIGEDYDADEIICIAKDFAERSKCVLELSQPTYTTNNAGKIVVDKTPDNSASPNLGDSVMMAFAPRRAAMVINPALLDAAM